MFLSVTFASVDWMMSLEPDWYSTIYGVMLICGWALTTFAVMVLAVTLLAQVFEPFARVITPGRLNDLGNLMLAFTMLWAYTSFMQFLIIWCGNLTEEIPYYLRRTHGGWQYFGIALVAFHFFSPFFMLLVRDIKRNLRLDSGGRRAGDLHAHDRHDLADPSFAVRGSAQLGDSCSLAPGPAGVRGNHWCGWHLRGELRLAHVAPANVTDS